MIEAIDIESRTTRDDHLSLRVWLRLLACTNLVAGRTRSRLRGEFATTMPRFDLLAQLERSPDGLRMSDLSQRLMVTGGNVTRIVDQLVDDGWVLRTASVDDRRSYTVRLTPKGRKAFAAMAERHEEWIVEMFGALSAKERAQLYALLAKLKAHVASLEEDRS
jgi:DNA-binding MarR family transcriptional regulator